MQALNVLFIGNSHTYLHNMPGMAVKLGENGGHPIDARQITGEGASLEWHWKRPDTRNLIREKKWNYVVLQERSGGPLENRAGMSDYALRLHKEIKAQGARTVLFMTWANKHRPETQKAIADAYTQVAGELGATLAPVGLAWEKVRLEDPAFDLYHSDGRHANPMGAYLTACVFYTIFAKKSPAGLPGTLFVSGKERVCLSADQASFLHKIAEVSLVYTAG